MGRLLRQLSCLRAIKLIFPQWLAQLEMFNQNLIARCCKSIRLGYALPGNSAESQRQYKTGLKWQGPQPSCEKCNVTSIAAGRRRVKFALSSPKSLASCTHASRKTSVAVYFFSFFQFFFLPKNLTQLTGNNSAEAQQQVLQKAVTIVENEDLHQRNLAWVYLISGYSTH